MDLLIIFFAGWIVLIGALALNGLAAILKVPTWYDLVKKKPHINIAGYFWLFVLYPLGLGVVAAIVKVLLVS